MKILEILFCFYPDVVGGTEGHVAALSWFSRDEEGCDVLVAATGPISRDAFIPGEARDRDSFGGCRSKGETRRNAQRTAD